MPYIYTDYISPGSIAHRDKYLLPNKYYKIIVPRSIVSLACRLLDVNILDETNYPLTITLNAPSKHTQSQWHLIDFISDSLQDKKIATVARKYPLFYTHVISQIHTRNGFKRKEVARIRKALYDIAYYKLAKFNHDTDLLTRAFLWYETKQSFYYWSDISAKFLVNNITGAKL